MYQINCPGCNDSYIGKTEQIYAQEQKNMPVVIKKMSFMTILTIAVITGILKIYSIL